MPVGKGMDSGLMTRIAIEWRQQNQSGLFASLNLDTGYDGYTDRLPAATNLTSFFEFYIDPSFCVFLTAGYAQHLSRTPFASSFAEDGIFEMSVGFTAAIF